jgi:murein L,D-transpeptidase YcbB/YkuD
MLLGVGAPVKADDGESWFRFGASYKTHSYTSHQQHDRSLAKQWEINPPRGFPTLARDNVGPMKAAVKRYADIAARGGWRPVPNLEMGVGMSDPAVAILRERLLVEGDIGDMGSFPETYDDYLARAVRRFQVRHGLTPTGVVNKQTIAALNVPAAARLRQLRVNLDRVNSLATTAPARYVLVNIPAAQIEAVDNGRVVSRHAAVVGKLDRQTPILKSAIHELNFNPVWHLPPTVIEKDLLPKGQEMQRTGKSVLAKYGIDAYDGNGKKLDPFKVNWSAPSAKALTFRQNPGPENPLGFVKINFHNPHSVYMHDTPSQTLFGRNFRAASSGCVRVQNIEQLAAWILQDNGDWTRDRILAAQRSGERIDAKVKKPVTLFFAYITAWATEDGLVHFRRDLYQRDGVGVVASAY